MLVVTKHRPIFSDLRTSSGGRVVLEHQLGIEVKVNDLSGQTLRCSERVTWAEPCASTMQQLTTAYIEPSADLFSCNTEPKKQLSKLHVGLVS